MKKISILFVMALSIAAFGCKKKGADAAGGSGSANASADVVEKGGGSGSAVVAAAGGGGGGGAASDADCKVAIDHGMELSAPMMSKMPNYADTKDKMREMGIQHCTGDKWGADAVKCMTDAKTMEEAQACYGKLTPEQSTKMNDDAKTLMTAPAAAGSGSGSGSAK